MPGGRSTRGRPAQGRPAGDRPGVAQGPGPRSAGRRPAGQTISSRSAPVNGHELFAYGHALDRPVRLVCPIRARFLASANPRYLLVVGGSPARFGNLVFATFSCVLEYETPCRLQPCARELARTLRTYGRRYVRPYLRSALFLKRCGLCGWPRGRGRDLGLGPNGAGSGRRAVQYVRMDKGLGRLAKPDALPPCRFEMPLEFREIFCPPTLYPSPPSKPLPFRIQHPCLNTSKAPAAETPVNPIGLVRNPVLPHSRLTFRGVVSGFFRIGPDRSGP